MRYVLLIALFVPLLCFAQVNKVDQKGWKQGPWVKYYPDNKVPIYQGQFKNDKPYGEFRYYFSSGKLKAIIQHQNNLSNALYYFENDQLMASGNYKEMKKDSVWTNYNSQGFIISRETYLLDKLNGIRVTYYLEGQGEDKEKVLTIENYKDSMLDGAFESYFVQGVNKEKGTYKKNKKEGEWLTYYNNGVITSRCTYRNGLQQGWAYGYDTKGKLVGKTMFNKGIQLKGEELEKYLEFCKQKGIDPNN
jgi:YD repeat-containing protein